MWGRTEKNSFLHRKTYNTNLLDLTAKVAERVGWNISRYSGRTMQHIWGIPCKVTSSLSVFLVKQDLVTCLRYRNQAREKRRLVGLQKNYSHRWDGWPTLSGKKSMLNVDSNAGNLRYFSSLMDSYFQSSHVIRVLR